MIDLTHWGRVMHICVGNLTTIGPYNVLSPGRRQAIIWTNAGILLIGSWGTNFSEILIGTETFSFKKMHLKMSSAKWRLLCLGLNVLTLVFYSAFDVMSREYWKMAWTLWCTSICWLSECVLEAALVVWAESGDTWLARMHICIRYVKAANIWKYE